MSPELPPELGMSMLKRALIGAVAIVLMTAGAVSAAVLLTAEDLIDRLETAGEGRPAIPIEEIDRADAGDARTIMVIGSDQRWGDKELGIPPRSDTIILARMDPDKDAITLMSIPRDLKVTIPGKQYSDKINAAYSAGGVSLTLKTVRQLLSPVSPDGRFKIHHVVQIDFGGFRRAVDYLGCVYVDIDQRYYNPTPGAYATIDIQPGYQKLCGRDALDYVRYRHTDNDIVRAARQQDFLRQMKDQDSVRQKLTLKNRNEIVKIIGRYTDVDARLHDTKTLFSLLKLGIYTATKPIQEVKFCGNRLGQEGEVYLTCSEQGLEETVRNFLNAKVSAAPRGELEPTAEEKEVAKKQKKRRKNRSSSVPGLEIAEREGEDQAIIGSRKIDFPFYYPKLRVTAGRYAAPEPRTYSIRDATGKLHRAYRLVLKTSASEYYGIQGTSWKDPPILDGPHDVEKRNGRKLQVYYDGRRVRLVAWKTSKATYYVHNTLLRTLSKRKMLAIAESLSRLGSK